MDESQQNPYDFILNNPQPNQKKSFLANGGLKKRLFVVGAGALLLIIVFIVMSVVVSGAKSKDINQLYQVAAAQQDLIDISKLGTDKALDQQIVNQSETTYFVVTSQYNDTKSYISKKGLNKASTAKITASRDSSYKKLLDDAEKSGKYDETYQAIYINRVDLYSSKLQKAYASVSSNKLKNQLQGYEAQLSTIVGER